jgi:hypothetical protein
MAIKDWFKNFWFRIKIFSWYLVTEPWRQFKVIFGFLWKIGETLDKTFTWIYIFLAITGIAIYKNERPVAIISFLGIIALFLFQEWRSGYYMHAYRESVKDRVRRELKKKEANKLEQNKGG